MKMGWIVAVGSACLLAPAVASAQNPQGNAQPPSQAGADTSQKAAGKRTKPNAEAATAGSVTPSGDMGNPKMIGSPAWWSTHATADGKPKKKEESKSQTPKKGQ